MHTYPSILNFSHDVTYKRKEKRENSMGAHWYFSRLIRAMESAHRTPIQAGPGSSKVPGQ